MYNPIEYWSKRKDPNPYNHVQDKERKDLDPIIKESSIILDYGVGNGRLMPLYSGKKVHGVDIVDTYRKECERNARKYNVSLTWSKEIKGVFSLGVMSKVLLHEPEPQAIIDRMGKHCGKVFISTAIDNDSPHCFNHDYWELLAEYKISLWKQYGREIHIVYAN